MGRHSTAITPQVASPPPSPSKKRKIDEASKDEIEVDLNAPEPPSKKALRKSKRVKLAPSIETKQEEPKGTASDTDEIPLDAQKPSKRSKYGVWVGNLSWTTSKVELREFFINTMEISDSTITRLHMPAPSKNASATPKVNAKLHNKGFAYVDFDTEEALSKALGLTEKLFFGRKLLIKNANSFEGRPEPTENGSHQQGDAGKPPSRRVFIGNLDFAATQEDLREHFQQCGVTEEVHVATFEDSGKCKGYAWIEFAELDAAQAAVRGWVERKQEIIEDEEDEENSSEGIPTKKEKSGKKPKTRKWWVNRFLGRSLKIEFAEGKDVRYKKRFGKNPALGKEVGQGQDAAVKEVEDSAPVVDQAAATGPSPPTERRTRRDARSIKPGAALAGAPRLTGSIVESQGKKITFQ